MYAHVRAARKPIARLMAGLLLIAAAACAPVAPLAPGADVGQRIDPGAAVPVALLVPTSDPEGGAILARSAENAARLAIADLQGAEVDLRVYDTAGQPGQAAEVARQAVADGAKIILGPVYSQTANAAGVAVAGQNVNLLSLSNNTSIAGGNVFVLGNTFENTAQRLVEYAVSQGKRNIFVIHGTDLAEQQGRDAILSAISRSPASLAGVGSFELSQEGVTSAAPRLAREANAAGADAVFLTSGTSGALPFLADLLPEAGLDPDVTQYIGLQRLDIPTSALSLRGLQGAWFALPDQGMSDRFAARYRAAYGMDPHPIVSAPAYDGIAAIGALAARGDRGALTSSALTQGQGFAGANGVFRLLPGGTIQRGLAVAQVQNNQVVVIDPARRSFGGAGF
ncbi:penicillin-binding protein activator [Tranquillimonas alkanivorans]|uniref:Amino acid/amide ABC transporter substrate-binding protein, HAAT family n=1 Tax=Tranquillimonas alkanivorans TaxID=441119 RepID=A0A1I5TYG9_9RHOB|nr:penicillin-binding protein activator [Tranquillimonas alkanivorans]SFP88102.1 amino acid/amide ABC transporter substrate-binding protein, HAAT family [Tranquillimonas alkanivorans]